MWGRVVEKRRAPESFLGFCGTCEQGGGKTFRAPESFLGFCGTCDWGQGGGKTFWAPESFLGFVGLVTGGRVVEKLSGPLKVF